MGVMVFRAPVRFEGVVLVFLVPRTKKQKKGGGFCFFAAKHWGVGPYAKQLQSSCRASTIFGRPKGCLRTSAAVGTTAAIALAAGHADTGCRPGGLIHGSGFFLSFHG